MKLCLDEIKPAIWRRFLIERNRTFEELHEAIQIMVGWKNYHLYNFGLPGGIEIEPPDEEDASDTGDPGGIRLSSMLKNHVKKLRYVYDFGDCWEHTLMVEKNLDIPISFPECIGGMRAFPPEDCGGFEGYEDFLKAIKDKNHPEHEDMLQWAGGKFDPELFDIKKANKKLEKRFKRVCR